MKSFSPKYFHRQSGIDTPSIVPETSTTSLRDESIRRLQERWMAFDKSVPPYGKMHPDFQGTKEEYESSILLLKGVKNDTELKKDTNIIGKIDANIGKLNTFLAQKSKKDYEDAYVQNLASFRDELASLRQDISGKPTEASVPPSSESSDDENPIDAIKKHGMTMGGVTAAGAILAKSMHSLSSANTLEEKVSAFDKIKDKFTKMWDFVAELFEKLFSGDFKGLLAMFKPKPKEEKEGQKNPESEKDEKKEDIAYMAGKKTIMAFFVKKGDEKNVEPVFDNETFKKKPYGILMREYVASVQAEKEGKKYPLGQKLGIQTDGTILNDRGIHLALSGIFGGKHGELMQKTYLRNNNLKNVNEIYNIPLDRFIASLSSDFSILRSVQGIDPSDLDGFSQKFGFNVHDKNQDGNIEISGELGLRAKEHFSVPMLTYLMLDQGNTLFESKSTNLETFKKEKHNPKEGEEMEKFLTFAENFRTLLATNDQVNLGLGADFQELVSGKTSGLTYSGLARLYVIMNGRTDFAQMSAIEKLGVYAGVCAVAAQDSFVGGKLLGRFMDKISSNDVNIPPEVKDLSNSLIGNTTEMVANGIWSGVKGAFGLAIEQPKTAIGILVLGYILPIFGKKQSMADMVRRK